MHTDLVVCHEGTQRVPDQTVNDVKIKMIGFCAVPTMLWVERDAFIFLKPSNVQNKNGWTEICVPFQEAEYAL